MPGLGPEASSGEHLTATGRVPVEHRVFGLDRRSLLPGLVVLGVFVLWTVVVPVVNDLLSSSQQTKAGDVFALGEGLTMDAQPGWGVDSGLLTSDEVLNTAGGGAVSLHKGGVSFAVVPGPFRGSATELLGQIEKVQHATNGDEAFHISTVVRPFRTDDGRRGVAEGYTTIGGEGVVTALVDGTTGLEITFTGTAAAIADQNEDVGEMIDSIRVDAAAAR